MCARGKTNDGKRKKRTATRGRVTLESLSANVAPFSSPSVMLSPYVSFLFSYGRCLRNSRAV